MSASTTAGSPRRSTRVARTSATRVRDRSVSPTSLLRALACIEQALTMRRNDDDMAESTRTLLQPVPEVNARLLELYVLLPARCRIPIVRRAHPFAKMRVAIMGGRVRSTILVVDDDPGIREALHLVLDDEYEVIDAVDGVDALAALASRKIDLMLLDLVMVHGDGFEVLEHQSKELERPPIIALSGLNNASTAATAMRLGAVDYVTKPFDEEALRELVR